MSDKVLIVDDSLTVRMDLKDAFDNAGFEALTADSAQAARRALRAGPIRVFVLDVLLPDGDGVDLLTELRAAPESSDAVVLMLSTEAEIKDRLRGLQTGADEYVGKPYDANHVVARARELLRARRGDAGPARTMVLIVDDSVTFRESMRQACEEAGHSVRVAGSGEEALRILAAERPDAVVVDSELPGVDGATVIRRLRLDASLRDVPCLLLTGLEDRDAELRALDAGADAFARKAEDVKVVLARLATILRSAATGLPERAAGLLGPKRLLAVDDSATYLSEVASVLHEEGYDVVTARSGMQALELLAVQPVDCILLDLIMPDMDGRETCRKIKAAPILRDIPLLMLTALEDRNAMFGALEAGADDYVQKSSEFDVLKARVRAQLRRKQFEDENRRAKIDLMSKERDAAEARAARALADSRAELLASLEQKHRALEAMHAELARANEAKTEFLSTMSHELRTPLNSIIGFSEIMLNNVGGELAPRHAEFVKHVHDSGQHLLELVNDILDLSKIEAGKAEIDPEPIDLDSFLIDSLAVIRERALNRRVHLEVQGSGRREMLRVDRRRLKQILYNLLSNALKFTPEGGRITLQASLVEREQAAAGLPGFEHGVRDALPESAFEHFAQISVLDTGVGIAHDDLGKLFAPFSQIKSDIARNVEGTGLGLVTVLRLAQLHCGTVAATSEPGVGSCFTVWLPWAAATAAGNVLPATVPPPSDKPLALLVEDDTRAAEIMHAQLQAMGFRTLHAPSAEIALSYVGQCTPDLITLDIRLPGMDGWDFLSRIKSLEAWSQIPVVVVSVSSANHEIGLSLGAAAVLQKPVSRVDLSHELSRLGIVPTPAREMTVLVVDDDPNAVELMSAYLSQPGYTVLRAYGGQEGIELSRRHAPDLVVLDLLMPDIGGIEVVEALKREKATASIPVLMVTAKQFTSEERLQLDSHVLSVVNKSGFRKDRFVNEVRRAFVRSPREQQRAIHEAMKGGASEPPAGLTRRNRGKHRDIQR